MNKSFWTDDQQIVDYAEILRSKGSNRTQIDDTIYRLNKLKPEIQQLNLDLISCDWNDQEKSKRLHHVSKLKEGLLRQLIRQIKQTTDHKLDYQWNSKTGKMTLIFYKDKLTLHVSHIQIKSLLYITNDITLIKDMISRITDNKLRNDLFLKLKLTLGKEI